ncbi:Acyl-coenzyme A thioesterase PaaI [Pseudovibrio sp. Ad13]|uniref:hydroxyphenylacetyl-CoA thioesterase PaaI n=1 Tax=unclassified Pseudovibrio TaxID=2627060 RepID=UPI0007102EB3|nr:MULTISPECIES: hydroxyphenylacetyl-CoA thioesterase PaaI [unclassified Pseudovibrio]KZK85396.1 Acyl-coenzyme A thioesterase PaaI [Pseudovibrio sp. Ad13]KZL03556.1 Acyl-coenzyme A thioesterase PaaI [Pseudovibrio sp. W74]KZL10259.1 Acyl-coenzyme A thioesterase PaaI [Pseudovibrio sp. Ad14]KZL14286.1 Acyl-coenzyme A thioesterase PaaI [Pseudovibrio sp. Ad26]KZL19806.1 Acyl-coenzyme A thioesterase PaaI [Pseudovibrio sp. WM33]
MNKQELAEAVAASMWDEDEATQALGMTLDEIAPGRAVISMKVMERMTNGHKTCHGGYIFTLADSAFAFACNSHNQRVVAFQCSITYLAPAFEDDVLTATAEELTVQGRSGIYDIHVRNQDGAHIAEFRGNSRTIKGTHIELST